MDPRAATRLRRAAMVALAIYSAGYLGWIAAHPDRYQWDFAVYYYAARAWLAGENPYDLEALHRTGGEDIWLPFVYLPASLLLFVPFALLPYLMAWYLWLTLLLVCLALLVRLWRGLLPGPDPLVLWGALVFGFGGALIWAVRSGNVVLLNQLLLWTGFVLLLRDRPFGFAVLVALVSVFKVDHLALVVLPALMPGERRRNLWAVAVGLAVFALLGVLPLVGRPDLARGYWGHVVNLRETGKTTPCALALIDHAYGAVLQRRGLPSWSRELLWGLYCLAVLGLSWRTLRRVVASGDRALLLMVAIILYALLVPRLKIYSYIMLLPPTLLLYLPVMARLRAEALYLVLVALPGVLMQPEPLTRVYYHYYPFLVNLLMWVGYVLLGGQEGSQQGQAD